MTNDRKSGETGLNEYSTPTEGQSALLNAPSHRHRIYNVWRGMVALFTLLFVLLPALPILALYIVRNGSPAFLPNIGNAIDLRSLFAIRDMVWQAYSALVMFSGLPIAIGIWIASWTEEVFSEPGRSRKRYLYNVSPWMIWIVACWILSLIGIFVFAFSLQY